MFLLRVDRLHALWAILEEACCTQIESQNHLPGDCHCWKASREAERHPSLLAEWSLPSLCSAGVAIALIERRWEEWRLQVPIAAPEDSPMLAHQCQYHLNRSLDSHAEAP